MPSAKIKTPLEPDRCYHIYNRGNNRELLFFTRANYRYFLNRFNYYLADHVDLYSYCLIPNHFHLLVRILTEDAGSQFRRFFQSYAVSINFQENRSGSLFQKTFRRILIEDNVYLKWLVFYIHYNPEKHRIVQDYRYYAHSSFRSLLSGTCSMVSREEVFEWFGSKQEFVDYHQFHYEKKGHEKYTGWEPGWQPSD